jgi:hypothetical protein
LPVHLAGIWSEGAIASLTPPEFWDRVAFISTTEEYVENGGPDATEAVKVAQADFRTWAEWRSPHKGEDIDSSFTALRSLGVRLSGKRKEELRRFLSSMSHWNQDAIVLQQEVIRCCFIPQLVTSGQEQVLDEIGRANTEWAILPTTIEKVRNCLR